RLSSPRRIRNEFFAEPLVYAVVGSLIIPSMRTNTRSNTTVDFFRKLRGRGSLLGLAFVGALLPGQAALAKHDDGNAVGTVFVIAMENHNFTQPVTVTNPQQIRGNPAAPYINSLITPADPNAAQVSYATAYTNAGIGVHPSEPNYVWAEAGTDFGVHTDADPADANHNIFDANHLTRQLDAAGVSWKNYQEDVQLSTSPLKSASGNTGPVNQFYHTNQFNYAVKHNPMAFFPDTGTENVFPLSQFFTDLAHGKLGAYNWITPNQFNDAHSALSGGFTYHGTTFTGDQAAIATGDNFLSQIVPQIMATPAYKNNGVIIIWWDESEKGDSPSFTIPEIVISPLAKGNAYASSVPLSHSSDLKTIEELYGLSFVNNLIPASETNAAGTGYNNVATVNDLSDLFKPGVIPAPSYNVTREPAEVDAETGLVKQIVHIANEGNGAAPAPLFLVVQNLSANATLTNADGTTSALPPLGSPFVEIKVGGDGILRPHETKTVQLLFSDPSGSAISYDTLVAPVSPAP
ncbi:MAG TPA: alkaline phosphatase family protein, partial [Polyangia bacterium]|nr:alkaline phosphatase family protein [Polyangia bacterium]